MVLAFRAFHAPPSPVRSRPLLPLQLTVATRSHVGLRRSRNEDAVESDPREGLVLVADGMGGHPAGDVASRLAVEEGLRFLTEDAPRLDSEGSSASGWGERMAEAVILAHRRVREEAAGDPDRAGMGTTLTILRVDTETRRFAVGHIGDSRAYVLRNGGLRRLTRDQTWVQQQVDDGKLTPEAAREHRYAAVLTQALGLDDPGTPQVREGGVQEDDVFLVCTDGLTGMVADDELEELLRSRLPEGVEATATALVEEANARGGTDNITLALVALGRGATPSPG